MYISLLSENDFSYMFKYRMPRLTNRNKYSESHEIKINTSLNHVIDIVTFLIKTIWVLGNYYSLC